MSAPPPQPSKTSTPDERLQQIERGLATLGLKEVLDALRAALANPVPEETRLDWLWRILEPQVRNRLENRVESRITDAKLPVRKTFQAFDFAFQPTLDRDLILELATLRFVDQGRNVLLAGMSGTGKSHIALALGLTACVANRRVLYTTAAAMLAKLTASLADDTLTRALKPYTRAELLIIDEVGLEQLERQSATRSGLLQKVLLPRYNQHLSTIITSNIPWDAWGQFLDDQLGAAALLDRLLERSHVIVINGPSYREWLHKQDVEARRTNE
jgi:DNA replication protein DnaC